MLRGGAAFQGGVYTSLLGGLIFATRLRQGTSYVLIRAPVSGFLGPLLLVLLLGIRPLV